MTIPSFETQLSFIDYEMGTGDGKNVAAIFRNNPNMTFEQASREFETKYERPAEGISTNARIENSRRVFNAGGVGISPRADQAYSYFRSQGWSPAIASGIVGNLMAESGAQLNPNSLNPSDGTDGSDSIGIAQWNSTRAQNLLNWDGTAIIPSEDFNDPTNNDEAVDTVDGPESAAEAVTEEERPSAGVSNYQSNVLNEFDSYTYNWAIHMVHPQKANRMEENITDGTFITLAQTGVENELSIESVTHQITTTFNRGNFREAAGNSFQVTLQEANGFTYFNRIKKACQELGIMSVTEINLLLELNFRGWNPDGSYINTNSNNQQSSLGPFYYNCVISRVDVKHDVGVSTYTLSLQSLPSKAFNRMSLYTKGEIALEASTFGEFIQELQTDYQEQVTEACILSPGAVIPDKYFFECEVADWKNWRFDIPDPEAARNVTSSNATGLTQFKFPKGTSLSDIIAQALMHTREFKRLPTASSGFAKEMPDGLPSADKMADLINWFTFKTEVQYGEFDQRAQKYQQLFTYKISPYITPEAVHDPESYKQLYSDSQLGKKRLDNIFFNGLMRKRYDYTYTGLNSEIYNLDMVFNNSHFLIQPIHGGALSDSSGYVGGQAEIIENKNNAQTIRASLRVIDEKLAEARAALVDIQEENGASIRYEPGRWDALIQDREQEIDQLEEDQTEQNRRLAELDDRIREATTGLLGETVDVRNLNRPNARYITQSDLYPGSTLNQAQANVEDRKTEITFNYRSPDGALAIDGSDNQNNIGSAMLGALELNLLASSDMSEVNMLVRGDPYWLGRPQGNLANNSAQANYDLGGLGFFLNARFPTYEDAESGLMRDVTDFQMTSVYRVTSVQATYMSGEFKMLLQAFRDPMINASQLFDQLNRGVIIG